MADISFATHRANYTRLWDGMKVLPKWSNALDQAVTKILKGKDRYVEIESKTGVPWWFSGVIHMRESDCNFGTYLGNGQSLSRVTTIVPNGRGPFTGPNAFLNGAIDAYTIQKYIGLDDWSIERILYLTEGYNGYGYMQQGKASPYVWGYTNQCPRGKYIRDHVYDPNAEETQPGTAALLFRMAQRDSSIKLEKGGVAVEVIKTISPEDIQKALNDIGLGPIEVDGDLGPKSRVAIMAAINKARAA